MKYLFLLLPFLVACGGNPDSREMLADPEPAASAPAPEPPASECDKDHDHEKEDHRG